MRESHGDFCDGCAFHVRSAVPVGTTHQARHALQGELARRGLRDLRFTVASNPDFLNEGTAVVDFMQPDRVVVGADDAHAIEILHTLYAPLIERADQWLPMATRSAELAQYACSAMLAARLGVMNEFALLAEALQADIEDVRKALAADARIGPMSLEAGLSLPLAVTYTNL